MQIIELTEKEWRARGKRLFGKDTNNWKFICPSCGNIQTIKNFKKYKNKGATPSDAYFNCIGRFSGKGGHIGGDGGTKKPCNYTTGGLIGLSPLRIKDNKGKIHASFDFYDQNLR